jgi:hypothetical protein
MPAGQFAPVTIPLYYQGHAYRAGSRLRVTISAPNGDQPIWAFGETDPPGNAKVTIVSSPRMPSQLLLPVVPGLSVPAGLPPCPGLRGEPCRDAAPTGGGRRPAVRPQLLRGQHGVRGDRPRDHALALGDLGLGRRDPPPRRDAPPVTDERRPGVGGAHVLDAHLHVRRGGPGGHARVDGPARAAVEQRGEVAPVHDPAAVEVLGARVGLDERPVLVGAQDPEAEVLRERARADAVLVVCCVGHAARPYPDTLRGVSRPPRPG